MGIGLSLGYGAGGAADALTQALAARAKQQLADQQLAQAQERIDLERQQAASDAAIRQAQMQALNDDRTAQAEARRQAAAVQLATMLAPGDPLDPEAAAKLAAGGFGALVQHPSPTLPSTAITGTARPTGGAPTIQGQLRMAAQPTTPGGDTYLGTPAQRSKQGHLRMIQQIIADPTTPPNVKQALQAGVEPSVSMFAPAPTLTPYQRASLDLDRQRLAADQTRAQADLAQGIDSDAPEAAVAQNYLAQFLNQTGRIPQGIRVYGKNSGQFYVGLLAKAAALAHANGDPDLATTAAGYAADEGSLKTVQKMHDATQSFLATADKNSALLEGTLKTLPETGAPLLNQPFRTFAARVQGDPNLSQFATYLTSVQNEYAKILTNPTLSGQLTDAARREAQILVSPASTVQQMVASLHALRAEGGNRLQSLADESTAILGRIGARGKPAAPAGPPVTPQFRYNPATGKVEQVGG